MPPQPQQMQQNLGVPVAIVIAGALIAAAVYFGGSDGVSLPQNQGNAAAPEAKAVPQPTATDHIIGNPNAKITIVEYTDLECPFCKQFHGTMKQVMDSYGASGDVAWVLRNFPLAQLHPNAPSLALAAECVAELKGNDAYWNFVDAVFREAPVNTLFDFNKLPSVVAEVGVDSAAFTSCFESERHAGRIEQDFNDAVESGGSGTPYSVFVLKSPLSRGAKDAILALDVEFQSQGARPGTLAISKDGKFVGMSGSLPLDAVKEVIDAMLK